MPGIVGVHSSTQLRRRANGNLTIRIREAVRALLHINMCVTDDCYPMCRNMKKAISHMEKCNTNGKVCAICSSITIICYFHAMMDCKQAGDCTVPLCNMLRKETQTSLNPEMLLNLKT